MAAFFALIVIILFSIVTKFLWSKRNLIRLGCKIPKATGIFSVIKLVLETKGHPSCQDVYNITKELTKPGPSPRRIWLGFILAVLVDDPAQLQKVLNSKDCLGKPKYSGILPFDRGLLISDVPVWKTHRKLINPAFSFSILKSFLPIFNEKSKIFIRSLEENFTSEEFDIFEPFARLGLDNILSTSTGLKKEIQTEKTNEFLEHCNQTMRILSSKIYKVWYNFRPYYKLTKTYQLEQKHVVNGLFKVTNEIIAEKENRLSLSSANVAEDHSINEPQIFIDQLYKQRDNLSMEDIRDETNTMFLAGFETVSTAMSMSTLLVAIHENVQDKLFEELQSVFETADEEVTEEKLDKLIYLEQVLKETMRFWAPIPHITRQLEKDMELGSYVVPAGSMIGIPIIHIHRDKAIWGNDADEFKPERFTPENYAKIHPYAYLPFSLGSRNCIGFKYAMRSMKVALSYFFRNFKVTTKLKVDDIEFEMFVVVKMLPGSIVSIQKREFNKSL